MDTLTLYPEIIGDFDRMNEDNESPSYGDCIRRELQIAFDDVDRGEVSGMDMDFILAKAHPRREARQSSAD